MAERIQTIAQTLNPVLRSDQSLGQTVGATNEATKVTIAIDGARKEILQIISVINCIHSSSLTLVDGI